MDRKPYNRKLHRYQQYLIFKIIAFGTLGVFIIYIGLSMNGLNDPSIILAPIIIMGIIVIITICYLHNKTESTGLSYECPHCGKQFKSLKEKRAITIKCPNCWLSVDIMPDGKILKSEHYRNG